MRRRSASFAVAIVALGLGAACAGAAGTPPWGNPTRDKPATPPATPPKSSEPAPQAAPVPGPPGVTPPTRPAPATPSPAPARSGKRAKRATRLMGPPAPPGVARRAPAARPAGNRATLPATSSLGLSAELPEHARVESSSDGDRIGAVDLARLIGATKYWHAELRKLELRTPLHRLQLTVDNPFVLLDDRTLELPFAVRSSGGQLQVPVALIDSLPRDTTLARLFYDSRRALVLRVPAEGLVRTPRIDNGPSAARLTFPTERPEGTVVVSRSRAHFRVHFGGLFVGGLPDSIAPGGVLTGIRPIAASDGSAFELALAPGTRGFRLEPAARGGAVELEFTREPEAGFERFAPEGPEGSPRLKVIVLDPGHGGSDAGVTVTGEVEKDLTLELARLLAVELQRRLGARVVLTRTDDRGPSVQERAETANRAHADVVLSLHFDAAPTPSARGATAFCPPATYPGTAAPAADGPLPVLLLPWRDVATRHAVRSREMAEAVLSAFELRGLGPTRLREQLPYPLLGVNAPGLLLECATLTSTTDRARVSKTEGLADLARAIAAGLDAYRRAE